MTYPKIAIIMLTYNAPAYVKLAVESLAAHTQGVDYELIVVDNHSCLPTRLLLRRLKRQGKIHTLLLNRKNLLFARGNNAGSRLASDDVTHFLLINSDVEIRDDRWLTSLLARCPEGGICAYGLVRDKPIRADGYCILFDRGLYEKYRLDERYEWFWSITKIQAQALKDGRQVVVVEEHENILHHFGGKSGNAFRGAAGMDEARQTICEWFGDHNITILDRVGGDQS